ncbi:uncharacterized protein LOC142830212 [Pelodiscus sinensis]|uniref:uncharacterized protein LOC142830212 n=1 Tax=Pelodiscus sinensis TaxID=13735 RepID=UPI003F6B218D
MAAQDVETSFFSLSGVRERMRAKKNGALKTAKLNASLASKIKMKIINNSSIVKVSLKQNNKALALALSAEKANTQRLIFEKMLLQKEVEKCHFQNATLRQRLYFLYRSTSLPLSEGQNNSIVEVSWTDDLIDTQLGVSPLDRMTEMPMRVQVCKVDGEERCQGSSSAEVQTSLVGLHTSVPAEPGKNTTATSSLPPPLSQLIEEPLASHETNRQRLSKGGEPEPAFVDSHLIFGESSSCIPQSSRSCPVSALANNLSLSQCGDSLVQLHGHISERKKCVTVFTTSTPSSAVDFNLEISSNRISKWSIDGDSCASKTAKSNSLLDLPSEHDSDPRTESSHKELPHDLLQPAEAVCDAEVEPNFSRIAEFVTLEAKSQSNDQVTETPVLKKVSKGKKKRDAFKSYSKINSDVHRKEESPPNAKMVTKAKDLSKSKSKSHRPAGQTPGDALEEVVLQKGSAYALRQSDKAKNCIRTHVLNVGQSKKVEKKHLLPQEINSVCLAGRLSMESQFQSPHSASLRQKAPLNGCALQSSPHLENQLCSLPALQQDLLDVNMKCTKQKANRNTIRISKADDRNEENVQSSARMPEGEAECQAKKGQKSKRKMNKEGNPLRSEAETSGTCGDVQGVRKRNDKDLSSKTKPSRKTHVSPCKIRRSLISVQPDLNGDEIACSEHVPESNTNKTQKAQKISGVESHEKLSTCPREKVFNRVHSNTHASALKEGIDSRYKPKRKTYLVDPSETHLEGTENFASETSGITDSALRQAGPVKQNFMPITILKTDPDSYLEALISEPVGTNSMKGNPSLIDFSSAAHFETLPFHHSSKRLPLLEPPTGADHRIAENPSALTHSSVNLKESDSEQTPGGSHKGKKAKTSSKEPCQSTALPGSESKALQDLTNASFLSPITSETSSARPTRRRRDPVCYVEPKLNSKLRRGDPFTNTEFLHSPIYKTKRKKK